MPIVLAVAATLWPSLPTQASDNRNGATWYARAFESVPTLTEAEWDLVDRYRAHPSGPPSGELREILGRFNRAMNFADRGSNQKYSDYQLNYGEGFSLELPHLGRSRSLARVMSVDTLVKMHDGHTADAAGRIASLYRMGNHVGNDRIVVSSGTLGLLAPGASEGRIIALRYGEKLGGSIGLFWTEGLPPVGPCVIPAVTGSASILLLTDDLAAMRARFDAAGVPSSAPPVAYSESRGPTNVYSVFDPNCVRIAIAQIANETLEESLNK